jgi:hypothetical protein
MAEPLTVEEYLIWDLIYMAKRLRDLAASFAAVELRVPARDAMDAADKWDQMASVLMNRSVPA